VAELDHRVRLRVYAPTATGARADDGATRVVRALTRRPVVADSEHLRVVRCDHHAADLSPQADGELGQAGGELRELPELQLLAASHDPTTSRELVAVENRRTGGSHPGRRGLSSLSDPSG